MARLFLWSSLFLALVAAADYHRPLQHPLILQPAASIAPRELTGRFLHLTDIHPDLFYRANSSVSEACHWKDKSDKHGPKAGYWGTKASDCDSPATLVDAVFDWLEKHVKDQVDFVVWTGDNARHDIDSRKPRSLKEIMELNKWIGKRMKEVFGHLPVVSSVGNNDLYPHNIMFHGPSAVTNGLLQAWSHFIPEDQSHTFARGGYYSIEAIPNQLLLISLNTLYMYDSNKAVDGCPPVGKNKEIDPGNEELDWLEQQLKLARGRQMQVWLTGHVPPSQANWYPRCYTRYGQLLLSFQDTIVGNLFGHMNVDHFFWVDADDIFPKSPKKQSGSSSHSSTSPSLASSLALQDGIHTFGAKIDDVLRKSYQDLPKRREMDFDDYSIVNVAPSVIPTYLPSLRIWQYNVTRDVGMQWTQDLASNGTDAVEPEEQRQRQVMEQVDDEDEQSWVLTTDRLLALMPSRAGLQSAWSKWLFPLPSATISLDADLQQKKKKKKNKKKHRKSPAPPLPRHADPNSPSRRNTFLSPLGYTQFFIDLDEANANDGHGKSVQGVAAYAEGKDERAMPEWKIEYTTFTASKLAAGLLGLGAQPAPLPASTVPHFLASQVGDPKDGQAGTRMAKVAETLQRHDLVPYALEDYTIKSVLKLGRRLGKNDKAWKAYTKRMYVGSGEE